MVPFFGSPCTDKCHRKHYYAALQVVAIAYLQTDMYRPRPYIAWKYENTIIILTDLGFRRTTDLSTNIGTVELQFTNCKSMISVLPVRRIRGWRRWQVTDVLCGVLMLLQFNFGQRLCAIWNRIMGTHNLHCWYLPVEKVFTHPAYSAPGECRCDLLCDQRADYVLYTVYALVFERRSCSVVYWIQSWKVLTLYLYFESAVFSGSGVRCLLQWLHIDNASNWSTWRGLLYRPPYHHWSWPHSLTAELPNPYVGLHFASPSYMSRSYFAETMYDEVSWKLKSGCRMESVSVTIVWWAIDRAAKFAWSMVFSAMSYHDRKWPRLTKYTHLRRQSCVDKCHVGVDVEMHEVGRVFKYISIQRTIGMDFDIVQRIGGSQLTP